MLPEFPEFKEIDLSDRSAVERYLARSPRHACEFSFANLFIWRDFDRPRFTTIDGNLCVLIDPLDEPRFFLEPLGNGTAALAAKKCLDHAGRISRASSEFVSSIRADACRIEHMRDHFDYVYRVRDLAELKGRRYDGKRNHIKAFERSHPKYEFVTLTAADRGEAMRLFEEWCASKIGDGDRDNPGLEFDCQRWALQRAFEG
ncbi:MAG: phosphatidylglycerol lysyltransferase domain-containing protein, partial [bacterium]